MAEAIALGQSRALADQLVVQSDTQSVLHRQVLRKVDRLPRPRPEEVYQLEVAGHQSNQAPWEAPWVATSDR